MVGFGHYRRPFRFRSSPRAENQQVPPGCLLIVMVPLLFAVSAWFAWRELRFFVQGTTVEASVEDVHEITKGRRYARRTYLAVRYSFEDRSTGQIRSERDDVPDSWSKPERTVRVEYISESPGMSRLAGHRNHVAVMFFIACVAAASVYFALLFRQARRAVEEGEAFESQRRRESP